MNCDISTIVDVSARKPRSIGHCCENIFGDRASNRGHRGDEMLASKREDRGEHSAGDGPLRPIKVWMTLLAQSLQLCAELIQNKDEAGASGIIRRLNFTRATEALDDQVDRAV